MADQQQNESEKPKRHYTPRTPKVDSVIKAIQGGEYDDNIFEIRDAVQDRVKIKQDAVLELVHEIFGEEAQIVTPREGPSLTRVRVEDVGTDQAPMPKYASAIVRDPDAPFGQGANAPRPNPFFEKLKQKNQQPIEATDHSQAEVERLDQEMLPGPYRKDPNDGNSFRVESRSDTHVLVTDIFGGHQASIPVEEWESWEEVSGNEDFNAELDQVEAKMEPAVDIERRGASISGLHSSDIGE